MNSVSHQVFEAKSLLRGKAIAYGRKAPLHQRLRLAKLLLGDVPGGDLTYTQVALLAGVSARSVSTVDRATLEQSAGLFDGTLSLNAVRKANAKPCEMTDADIEDFIDRVDPNRVLAALDRLTAPQSIAAK